VYRLASLDPLAHPDLITVATRIPKGVLRLISALSFHELTTQVPHANRRRARAGQDQAAPHPPTRFF
jgi:hypothetical protein